MNNLIIQHWKVLMKAIWKYTKNGKLASRPLLSFTKYLQYFIKLNLSQTSPGFHMSAVQVFWKHCRKRRNCSWRAVSPFPSLFFNCLKNFLPYSSNLKLSSSNSFSFKESKICLLQILSVLKSLKFVIWERVKSAHFMQSTIHLLHHKNNQNHQRSFQELTVDCGETWLGQITRQDITCTCHLDHCLDIDHAHNTWIWFYTKINTDFYFFFFLSFSSSRMQLYASTSVSYLKAKVLNTASFNS